MPWSKPASGTLTALDADTDLSALLYRSDENSPVPNEYHFELVAKEQQPDGSVLIKRSAVAFPATGVPAVGGEYSLTNTEAQTLRTLLLRLKNNRLKAMGYTLT